MLKIFYEFLFLIFQFSFYLPASSSNTKPKGALCAARLYLLILRTSVLAATLCMVWSARAGQQQHASIRNYLEKVINMQSSWFEKWFYFCFSAGLALEGWSNELDKLPPGVAVINVS